MANVKAVVLRPDSDVAERVTLEEVGGSCLRAMQEQVGGNIELVGEIIPYCDAFVNEDGIALGLSPSMWWEDGRQFLLGPVLFCGHDAEGRTTDISSIAVKFIYMAFGLEGEWDD